MSTPLVGAYLRIARAHEHFRNLEHLIALFKAVDGSVHREIVFDPETFKPTLVTPVQTIPIPAMVSVYAGECVQNLRAALDYLVFELAKFDSGGVEQDGTQFPLDSSKGAFKGHSQVLTAKGKVNTSNRLPGLTTTHITAIESLQPYKGTHWARMLRELSNPDKHRKLHENWSEIDHEIIQQFAPPGSFDDRTDGFVLRTKENRPRDMYVKVNTTLNIRFVDSSTNLILPLIPTLKELLEEVCAVLVSFEPEFE